MSAPLKAKGRACDSAPLALRDSVGENKQLLEQLQAFPIAKAPVRRCVVCGSRVTNRNLGGYNGRSALSGTLWCSRCADSPAQRILLLEVQS